MKRIAFLSIKTACLNNDKRNFVTAIAVGIVGEATIQNWTVAPPYDVARDYPHAPPYFAAKGVELGDLDWGAILKGRDAAEVAAEVKAALEGCMVVGWNHKFILGGPGRAFLPDGCLCRVDLQTKATKVLEETCVVMREGDFMPLVPMYSNEKRPGAIELLDCKIDPVIEMFPGSAEAQVRGMRLIYEALQTIHKERLEMRGGLT